jgi:hypothetical protein
LLKTTSQLISHYKEIEEKQAALYTVLAKKYPQYSDQFEKLAKSCLRHMEIAQRTYREGITDAFEVGFLANQLDPEKYMLNNLEGTFSEEIKTIIDNEERIISFCKHATTNSSKLIPDLIETFERIIKIKKKNIDENRKLV